MKTKKEVQETINEMERLFKSIKNDECVKLLIGQGVMFLNIKEGHLEGGLVGALTPRQQLALIEAFQHQSEKIKAQGIEYMAKMLADDMPKGLKSKLNNYFKNKVCDGELEGLGLMNEEKGTKKKVSYIG